MPEYRFPKIPARKAESITIRRCMQFLLLVVCFLKLNPSFGDGFVFPSNFPKELRQQHQQAFTKIEILDAWHSTSLYFLENADFGLAIQSGQELQEYAVSFKQPKYEAGAYEILGMAYEYLGLVTRRVNQK